MLKVAVGSKLTYLSDPSSALGRRVLSLEEAPELPSSISFWEVNHHAYEFNGTIDFSIDNREDYDGDYIGVFVGSECRGFAKRKEYASDGSFYYSAMVYSNVAEGEMLSFKYYNSQDDKIINYDESVEFTANMIVGNLLNTFGLSREAAEETSFNDGLYPANYTIDNIYPNPFNPTTRITYGIPEDGTVKVVVYNIIGEEITTLVNAFHTTGYHTVVWNADNHSSGIYFVQMIAGEYISTQKLMLVK